MKTRIFNRFVCAQFTTAHKQEDVDRSIYEYVTEYCNTLKKNEGTNLNLQPEELTFFLLYCLDQVKLIHRYTIFHPQSHCGTILQGARNKIEQTMSLFLQKDNTPDYEALCNAYWAGTAELFLAIIMYAKKGQYEPYRNPLLWNMPYMHDLMVLPTPSENVLKSADVIMYDKLDYGLTPITMEHIQQIIYEGRSYAKQKEKEKRTIKISWDAMIKKFLLLRTQDLQSCYSFLLSLQDEVHDANAKMLCKDMLAKAFQHIHQQTPSSSSLTINNLFQGPVGQVANTIEQQTLKSNQAL